MSNRQLHNLTSISNSIDSADLFVVVDKSELTTNTISLGVLSDVLDDIVFLSSSYSLTSSLTAGTTLSCSLSEYVSASSFASAASGSGVIATSSSYSVSSSYCYTHTDTFEVTSSSDTLNILTSPRGDGVIYIKPRAPFGNIYVIKPTSFSEILGSKTINALSGSITYSGLPSNLYEFEVSKLDSVDRPLKFGVKVDYKVPATSGFREFVYFSPGGAQYAVGDRVFSISSSFASTSSVFSKNSLNSISTSVSTFTDNCTGSGVFSISASLSARVTLSERCRLSHTSSNGPLPGMILIYAGVFLSGSKNWYNCDGRTYTSSLEPGLAAALGQKFATGSPWPSGPVVINRLPKISTNLPTSSGGTGPYNSSINTTNTERTSSGPMNSHISQSYGVTSYITGSYSDGTIVYGTNMGPSGSAFYYNIKR